VVMKSDGTNAVSSDATDDGTNYKIGTPQPGQTGWQFGITTGNASIYATEPLLTLEGPFGGSDQPPQVAPETVVGGLVPNSDTNTLLPNYGTWQGQGTTQFKFPVGFNGQSAPLYTIDILSDEPSVHVPDPKINIAWAGGFDTTAAAIEEPGIQINCHANRVAGTNPLTNSCYWADAENGQVNNAWHSVHGNAIFELEHGSGIGQMQVGDAGAANQLVINSITANGPPLYVTEGSSGAAEVNPATTLELETST